ncbi:ASCH domain-containing protein [Longispora albida]|uniref:ASCH domain-containing protein n=1 Tax=Longispora albida TaxID=203523 RepID=UPI0003706C83|nr:ASCH domain-containing protein [Longispora albida]
MDYQDLPLAEFAFPGPIRDQLTAAILSGAKTSTSGLLAEYEKDGEPLPEPGQRSAVADSGGNRIAVIEVTEVRVIRVGDCDLQHALDEGEGFETVADWRRVHEKFWHSQEMRDYLEDPGFTIGDDTMMVAERFKLVTIL